MRLRGPQRLRRMRLLLLDNYDSFTYNLHETIRAAGVRAEVRRNDKITVQEVAEFDAVVFSPGPGLPEQAGNMLEIIRQYSTTKPMFGVCLGLQAMAVAFGARLYNMPEVCHGMARTVCITADGDPLFNGLPGEFPAGRYHSWAVDASTLPSHFQVLATDHAGVVMAARHISMPVYGVQFHPESVMTPFGARIIANFINQIK